MDQPRKSSNLSGQLVPTPRAGSVAPVQPYYIASPYPSNPQDDPSAEVGLFEYWAILRRHKSKIFLWSFIGLALGFLAGLPLQKVYRAKASLEVLSLNQDFMNMKQTNPVNISMDSDVSEEATQAQLLSSASMLKRVTLRLNPNPAPPDASTRSSAHPWHAFLDPILPANRAVTRATLLAQAAASLKATAKPRTRIIEATVDSSDPHLAADFLNTLSEEFIKRDQESRLLTSQHTGDWLSHELNDAREKLRLSEDALQQYARTSGIILANDTTNVATEKLQQYQQALSAATTDRIAKQSRFELAQKTTPETLGDVLNDATLRETQSKITDLTRQIADLSTAFNPTYSKIVHLQAQLDSLQSAYTRQRADILAHITNDFQEAARKERLLSDAYFGQTREVTGQGEKAIQYNILKREVDSNRQLYDAMLQQMKQASIATAMRASNVRIVDPADAPLVPVFPNFKLNSLIGAVAGLVLSSFVILIRAQTDSTIHLPGEIKQWLDLTELGTIPSAAIGLGKPYYVAANARRALPLAQSTAKGPAKSVELATWQQQPSLLAESFRSALSSILFLGDENNGPRILAFTSAHPAEGKTTAVTNLAIAAADLRLKVLIIDADLRRPRLHQLFKLSNDRGLSDVLQETLTKDSLAGLAQPSGIPNVDVLTAGAETSSAAHLLSSPNLRSVVKAYSKAYDMIFIDTPPVAPMTDARIVSQHTDGVILVARAGHTTREALTAAKNRLEEDSTQVLGSLLNDWDPKRSSKSYYEPYRGYKRYAGTQS